MRTFRPTPKWLCLCPFLLAGCIGNSDPPPVPRLPAPGRLAPPLPGGPQVAGEPAGQKPTQAAPQGGFLLPSKYMLMTPLSNDNPSRPARYRPVPVPQGVSGVEEPRVPLKSR